MSFAPRLRSENRNRHQVTATTIRAGTHHSSTDMITGYVASRRHLKGFATAMTGDLVSPPGRAAGRDCCNPRFLFHPGRNVRAGVPTVDRRSLEA